MTNRRGTHNRSVSVWVDAVLAYASERCGVPFTNLQEADEWLLNHPENPLNQKAIRVLLTAEPMQ
jgi:hypothetical protein